MEDFLRRGHLEPLLGVPIFFLVLLLTISSVFYFKSEIWSQSIVLRSHPNQSIYHFARPYCRNCCNLHHSLQCLHWWYFWLILPSYITCKSQKKYTPSARLPPLIKLLAFHMCELGFTYYSHCWSDERHTITKQMEKWKRNLRYHKTIAYFFPWTQKPTYFLFFLQKKTANFWLMVYVTLVSGSQTRKLS